MMVAYRFGLLWSRVVVSRDQRGVLLLARIWLASARICSGWSVSNSTIWMNVISDSLRHEGARAGDESG